MLFLPSYSEKIENFGYQQHPNMLLESTDGVLQIYVEQNNLMIPKKITDLQISSSDNSVIKIINVNENTNDYSLDIKMQALKPGTSNIAVAAPGFSSKEIPVTVYASNNHATKILIKVTPNDFPIDGPRFGYVSVELANTGELPTKALEDTIININSPNKDIIKLEKNELVIPKGEYYTIEKFELLGSGDAMIFAESNNLAKVSANIHIRKPSEPLHIQLYTYPKNFNSFSTPRGYAIIELQDSEGKPVIADNDIHVSILVENPDAKVNTSNDYQEINFEHKNMVIKKGEYLAYTKFTPRPDLGRISLDTSKTYNISLSAEDYTVVGDHIEVTHREIGILEGGGPTKIEVIPFLTTGKEELIGIAYFETEISTITKTNDSKIPGSDEFVSKTMTVPVMAKENYKLDVRSSHTGTVKTDFVEFKRGDNAALIFGKTGTFRSNNGDPEIYITDNDGVKTAVGKPEGPIEKNLNLSTDQLISKILSGTNFPIVAFMMESGDGITNIDSTKTTDENGRMGITPFIKDSTISFSADNLFEIEHVTVQQNQPYALINVQSNKVGSSMISAKTSGFNDELSLTSYTTDPTIISLSYMKNILSGSKTLATIQLLDSANSPIYAKNDYDIKLVSNNKSIISIPDKVIINKGEYYANFQIDAKSNGVVEIAMLAEDLPLATFEINSVKVQPTTTLSMPESVISDERIEAKIQVIFEDLDLPLSGYSVNWEVSGGEIKQMEKETNENGVATINIIAKDPREVKIKGIVNGELLSNYEITKTVHINAIDSSIENTSQENNITNIISNSNLLFIIIPGFAVVGLFYLKRTDRMDGIMEKINIVEKIDNIRERINELKSR